MHHRCDRNGGMYMKYLLGQMRAKKYYEKVACVKKWMDANKEAMDKEDEERNTWFADVLKKATDAEAADGKINSAAEIEAIKESAGWKFPKVKLAAWDPEDETQWEAVGQGIAKRNLLSSIPNLTCGFGVWLVWSGEFLIIYAVL